MLDVIHSWGCFQNHSGAGVAPTLAVAWYEKAVGCEDGAEQEDHGEEGEHIEGEVENGVGGLRLLRAAGHCCTQCLHGPGMAANPFMSALEK